MKLTAFPQESLEVAIVIVCSFTIFGHGHEEAHEEDDEHQQHKSNGILESPPESRGKGLVALLSGHFIVLFIPEVGEGHDQQAENGVERV